MTLSDPAESREPATNHPADACAESSLAASAPDPGGNRLKPRGLTATVIVAAVVAGLVAWLVGETSLVWVAPKRVPKVTMGQRHLGTTAETEQAAAVATAARAYAVLGAALGSAFGVLGGLARRSSQSALTAAAIGVGTGALAGFLVSYGAIPLFFRYRDSVEADILVSMILHGLIWAAIGASAALALAVGLGARPLRAVDCVIGGALGALIGTAAFELVGAAFFANDETGEPISASAASRLCARLLVALFVAVGASVAFGERRSKRSPGRSDSVSTSPV